MQRKLILRLAIAAAAVAAAALAGAFMLNSSASGRGAAPLGDYLDAGAGIPSNYCYDTGPGPTGASGPTGSIGPTSVPSCASVSSGATGATGPPVPYTHPVAIGPTGDLGPISVSFHRAAATLTSVGVKVNPRFAKLGVQLAVLYRSSLRSHSSTTVYVSAMNVPYVPPAQRMVAPWAGPTGSLGPTGKAAPGLAVSPWSGAFSPSDWSGGCRGGVYWFVVTFVDPAYTDDTWDEISSKTFSCTGG